jgi:chromosome segregation ATPase
LKEVLPADMTASQPYAQALATDRRFQEAPGAPLRARLLQEKRKGSMGAKGEVAGGEHAEGGSGSGSGSSSNKAQAQPDSSVDALRAFVTTQISELRGAVGRLTGENVELRGAVGRLRGEIDELRGAVGRLRGEIDELRGAVGRLKGENASLRGAVGRLTVDNERIKADIAELQVTTSNLHVIM